MDLLGGGGKWIMDVIDKQTKIVRMVYENRRLFGKSPTYREISAAIGVSKSTVDCVVGHLCEKGVLTRVPNKSRALRLTAEAPNWYRLMAGSRALYRFVDAGE